MDNQEMRARLGRVYSALLEKGESSPQSNLRIHSDRGPYIHHQS